PSPARSITAASAACSLRRSYPCIDLRGSDLLRGLATWAQTSRTPIAGAAVRARAHRLRLPSRTTSLSRIPPRAPTRCSCHNLKVRRLSSKQIIEQIVVTDYLLDY
uniref:Uncharacterized protein n=1 Tax=Oryza rufipogon TaxID=4529 RepID=A0A0E0R4A5_ORYRU